MGINKHLSYIFTVLTGAIFILCGCTPDNPLTQNNLLRNKIISWTGSSATYYELHDDGSFIAIGGEYAQEGGWAGMWESVDNNGSFKIIENRKKPGNYRIARFKKPISEGSTFVFDTYVEGEKTTHLHDNLTVTQHRDIDSSHKATALKNNATVFITRYADDTYLLEIEVVDIEGEIKKVLLMGEAVNTEVMVTNATLWMNNPPITLPKDWTESKQVKTSITIQYHDGKQQTGTFISQGYRDKSHEVFEDAWF